MTSTFRRLSILCAAGALTLSACQKKSDPLAPTPANFKQALLTYLQARGDLCFGKQFPLDVSEADLAHGSRDARQMPVLERAGLVTSSEATGHVNTEDGPKEIPVHRYMLTDLGQRSYLSRPVPGQLDKDGKPVLRSDLCALKLRLEKITKTELTPALPQNPTSATLSYTYQVEPAPWMGSAEVQQVFPAIARVINGAGTAELKEGFTLTDKGWVANELVPPNTALANR